MPPLAVLHSTEEWRTRLGDARCATAVTVGNFDGLHLGHQQLLRGAIERARQKGLLAAAITFDPHPARILRPADAPPLIGTLAQRLAGFERLGLDAVLVLKFTPELSRVSPREFARGVLVETLRARLICVGESFRFGHRHAGDVHLLRTLGGELGFDVEIVPPVVVRGTVVSSAEIRRAVAEGRMTWAGRLLGRPFALTGQVQTGTGQGRRILVPTLNLAPEQELLPKNGVYVTETVVDGRCFASATNIGVRPTLDGKYRTIESHLFNFSDPVTSGPLEVRFWKRLRDERKFASVDELREQIQRDLARAQEFFRRRAHESVRPT